MKMIGFLLVFLFVQCPFLQADQLTSAKKEDALTLINMTGPKKMGIQVAGELYKEMIKRAKAGYRDGVVPAAARKIVRQETLNAVGGKLDEMVNQLVPIYARYYTHDEIKRLIAFYQTDLGRLILKKRPLIMQESFKMFEKWGRSLVPDLKKKINERIKKEGVESPAGK